MAFEEAKEGEAMIRNSLIYGDCFMFIEWLLFMTRRVPKCIDLVRGKTV